MTFRRRLAIAAALAVAVTVAIASAIVYVVMRDQLRSNVDQQLQQQATQILHSPSLNHAFDQDQGPLPTLPHGPSATATYMQAVFDSGVSRLAVNESAKVPVTKATLAVAARKMNAFFTDGTVGGKASRIYTVFAGESLDGHGVALQFVHPLEDVNHTLNRLRLILLLVVAGGIAAGAAGGALVSSAALVPVRRLTGAAERIAQTGRFIVGGEWLVVCARNHQLPTTNH